MSGICHQPAHRDRRQRSAHPSAFVGLSEPELCAFSADAVAWEDIRDVAEILWEEFEQEGPTGDRRLLLLAALGELEEKLWDEYERESPGGFAESRTFDPARPEPVPDCADGRPCEHGVSWDWTAVRPDLSIMQGPKIKVSLVIAGRSRSSHLIIALYSGAVLSGGYARPADALLLGQHARTATVWGNRAHQLWLEQERASRPPRVRTGGSGSYPPLAGLEARS